MATIVLLAAIVTIAKVIFREVMFTDETDAQNVTEMVSIACSIIKEKKLAQSGDSIVITAGVPFGNAGSTNLLRIAKIIDDKDLI